MATHPNPDEFAERSNAIVAALVSTFERSAEAFQHSAALAEREAERRAANERGDVEEERRAAARANEAARRARSQAERWRRYLREKSA
ncbi:MAG TPA: hypothetical protein VH300_16355 [Thermoleophilaceae bacterium]|nr:hypothetical protein [Thermoleophilaceae bacterium]